jgi:hypothetical protein
MLVLSRSDVDALIADISPDELIRLMADVFRLVSKDSGIDIPQRLSIQTDSHNTLLMPSRVDTSGTAIKVVSVPTLGGLNGLPATTLVMDEASGGVKAVVNARNLTAVRTAAGASFHQCSKPQLGKYQVLCWLLSWLWARMHHHVIWSCLELALKSPHTLHQQIVESLTQPGGGVLLRQGLVTCYNSLTAASVIIIDYDSLLNS